MLEQGGGAGTPHGASTMAASGSAGVAGVGGPAGSAAGVGVVGDSLTASDGGRDWISEFTVRSLDCAVLYF